MGELIVESRTEYINVINLKELKKYLGSRNLKITFAIGLEVADESILKKIKKGLTLKKFEDAVSLAREYGFGVRAYLMANLPYVQDVKKSLEMSVEYALKLCDSCAIINAYPYGFAPLMDLWLCGKWKPLDEKSFFSIVKKYENNLKISVYFDDYISAPKFPEQVTLQGACEENLVHPHYEVWQDYIERFYNVPEIKNIVLFLPCAFRKPYSRSQTHREIVRRLQGLCEYSRIHQVMISNPGVIPREFEGKYPFAHYDWPEWEETEKIKKRYIEVTQKRIEHYLATHKYKKYFCYLKPDSESYMALENACAKLKINLISCLDKETYDKIKEEKNPVANRKALDCLIRKLRLSLSVLV